jgi:hypothetical protein
MDDLTNQIIDYVKKHPVEFCVGVLESIAAAVAIGLTVLMVRVVRRAFTALYRPSRDLYQRLRGSHHVTVSLPGLSYSYSGGEASFILSRAPPPRLSHGGPSPLGGLPGGPLPQFVNNSQWAHWEVAQQQHDIGARFAMASTMKGFNAALL